MDPLIQAMESIVDDLYGHVHRVSTVAVELGTTLGLDQDDRDRLKIIGILHDVGKVHVDPAILSKPGPLVGDELTRIRRHPQFGFSMTVDLFDRSVAQAILFHHERYDGGGYPFGLKGNQIPRLARVVLVADAFDAITSHRSYQPALPLEFAVREITTNAGTQFDPTIVEAFMAGIDAGRIRPPEGVRPLAAAAAR